MTPRRLTLFALLLAILAGGFIYWKLTTTPPAQDEGPSDAVPPAKIQDVEPLETEEARTVRKLLGVWHDEYQGKRTMTLNADGSGTMLVELSGAQAFLFASKLRFDMRWSLAEKVLTKKTVGGEPADKVNLILNTMGNTAADTLLDLTDDRLTLLDKNGTTKYEWKRVMKDKTSVAP